MVSRLFVLVAIAACSPAAGTAQDPARQEAENPGGALVDVELATVGMDPREQAPVVLLREANSGKIVPIWVGLPEAQAILRALLGLEMPRPMTHDLLADVVRELGAVVEEVVVHDLQQTTYIGRIMLRLDGGGEVREIDSRPSDALALALRTDARIRVAGSLLTDPPEFDFLAPEADEQVVRILGTTVVSPTAALRERFDLPDRPGVVVVGTYGEAARKGLRRGDLIVEVNGAVPRAPMDFLDAILDAEGMVDLVYWRDGEERRLLLSPSVPEPPEPRRRPAPVQT